VDDDLLDRSQALFCRRELIIFFDAEEDSAHDLIVADVLFLLLRLSQGCQYGRHLPPLLLKNIRDVFVKNHVACLGLLVLGLESGKVPDYGSLEVGLDA